jgi:threonine synthase
MNYLSTRSDNATPPISLDAALLAGLASDGGLYVPQQFAKFQVDDFAGAESLPQIAKILLTPFFAGSALQSTLHEIVDEAFNFPLTLATLANTNSKAHVLELFHGPTAAFKDFGARFLAACFARLPAAETTRTILVATSGDTGGAVAAAFHRRAGFRVVILSPDGRVSPRQAHQLGAFGDNVHSFKVNGTFDDCQRLVKSAFARAELRQLRGLSSANSISLGRLLPQMCYYAWATVAQYRIAAKPVNFIIPTGNLGNALAAIWARECGLPIGQIVLATNANPTLKEFSDSGLFQARDAISTLANAMDVGAPSNFERLQHLLGPRTLASKNISVVQVTDARIEDAIRSSFSRHQMIVCPHTACAIAAWQEQNDFANAWTLVATAHPAKFDSIVEAVLDQAVAIPAELAAILAKPSHAVSLALNDHALHDALMAMPA